MALQTQEKNLLKEAIIQIGAGGSAGFVEVCIMHPMDLVKTRFQLQVKTKELDPMYYTGMFIFCEILLIIDDDQFHRDHRLYEKNV